MVDEATGRPRTPRLWFGERSYGGTSGCNSFGGLKIEREGRLFTYPGPQTQMACGGALDEQEGSIVGLFRAAPTIEHIADGIMLVGGGHTMRVVPDPPGGVAEDPPTAWQGSGLTEQTYEMHQFDGDSLNRRPAPRIAFGKSVATLSHLCDRPISGPFAATNDRVVIRFAAPCAQAQRYFPDTLHMVSGPNGELLLAGNGHWIAGDNLRRDRPK